MGMVHGKRSKDFVRGLLADSDSEMSAILAELNRNFGRSAAKYKILCYYETVRTRVSEVRHNSEVIL